MEDFRVPSIPKIFVPQNVFSRPESQASVDATKNESNSSIKDNSSQDTKSSAPESVLKNSESTVPQNIPPPPKLCASCSQILLAYLAPLQRYVNDVVQIARGDNAVTASPLIDLFNAEVLKSQTEVNTNVTPDERPQDNGESDVSHGDRPRHDHRPQYSEPVSHHSDNPTNQNHTSNENYNQNQTQNRNEAQTHYQDNYQRQEQHYDSRPEPQPQYGHQENVQHSQQRYSDSRQSHDDNRSTSDVQQTTHTERRGVPQSYQNIQKEDNQRQNSQDVSQNDSPSSSQDYYTPPQHSNDQSNSSSYEPKQEVRSNGPEAVAEETMRSPFAFVTIAYNNLSATNAVILANSLYLTNNKSMAYTDADGNKGTIDVPIIILIGGNIDPILKEAIYMVFDEVIFQPMDVKLALLSDQSFGIRQNKLQMWKELQNYQKCLFLESSTLVVGRVLNLFEECQELSACVDCVFPDTFNCAVFVFEPSLTTYEQMISFALFNQKCSAQRDESAGESLDEMSLLNLFFAAKWHKLSFVYNYVKNEAVYSHIPAFMRYGDTIKIVNFGHMIAQMSSLGSQPNSTSVKPWHVMFDLLASGQQDVVQSMPIDNFTKFYLTCFIQRLWPILQSPLTPLLVTKYGIGRRDWSIFELIRLLSNESGIETDDHMFTQTPITFRRIKSSAQNIAKYENLVDDRDEDFSQQFNDLENEDLDESPPTGQLESLTIEELESQSQPKVVEEKVPQVSKAEQDSRSKSEWEAGRVDWMGAHGSDKIISRLKKIIRND